MQLIDYKEQEKKLDEFELDIFSIKDYGYQIWEFYRINSQGPWYNRLPVFGFREGNNLPKSVRQICYDIFHEYFPTSITSTL